MPDDLLLRHLAGVKRGSVLGLDVKANKLGSLSRQTEEMPEELKLGRSYALMWIFIIQEKKILHFGLWGLLEKKHSFYHFFF